MLCLTHEIPDILEWRETADTPYTCTFAYTYTFDLTFAV